VEEVHRPHVIRPDCRLAILAELRLDTALRCLVPKLQTHLLVKLVGSFVVHLPTLAAQQHVDTPIPIPNTRLGDLLHARLECGLVGSAGAIVIGRGVDLENPAGPPDRDAPLTTHPVHQLALASRPQS
jgi:hypothetical protein